MTFRGTTQWTAMDHACSTLSLSMAAPATSTISSKRWESTLRWTCKTPWTEVHPVSPRNPHHIQTRRFVVVSTFLRFLVLRPIYMPELIYSEIFLSSSIVFESTTAINILYVIRSNLVDKISKVAPDSDEDLQP